MRRNPLLVVATVLAVLVSSFLVFTTLSGRAVVENNTSRWQNGVHVVIFLDDRVTTTAHKQLQESLESYPEVRMVDYFTKDEAAELGISPRSPVFQILNKIGLNKKFYIVDRIVIDQNKFPGLTEDIFKNRSNTIYNLYQNKYNIFITNCSEKLKAITADEKIAKLLNIPLHEPILKINRIGQTYHNETIELRTSYVHTSDIEYIHSQNSTFGEAI